MTPDNHPVVDLLVQLMGVSSTSEDELAVGLFLERTLQALGYTVERVAIAPGSDRHNVLAYLGRQRRTRVLLTAHMDTVPPHVPVRVDRAAGIVWGRGACDDKGSLAAQIQAVEQLRAEGRLRAGDVGLLFVVGEERGGPGMLAANRLGLAWEAVLFGEPTEGRLGRGHKGHLVFALDAAGTACHSGYPERGRSAIATLLRVLARLEATPWPASDLLGPSTFNVGKISGGEGYNVVAPAATALCAIRVAADLDGIRARVAAVLADFPDVRLTFHFSYPETMLDFDVDGFDSVPLSYGTDVPRLHGCHKKVLYGPGSILVAHGKDEHVRIDDLIESVAGYKRLALHFLAKPSV